MITYYAHGKIGDEDYLRTGIVIDLKPCDICEEKFICNNYIIINNTDENCFFWGINENSIKYIMKKEDFLTKEEMEL